MIPRTKQPDHLQATNYLKGLAGLSKMLERPNVDAALAQLEKLENTTVGNLVAFMHAYNLRFDAARTPKQIAVYRDLYPTMVAQRDKIFGKPAEGSADNPAAANRPAEDPTSVFHGFDPGHLYPKPVTPQHRPGGTGTRAVHDEPRHDEAVNRGIIVESHHDPSDPGPKAGVAFIGASALLPNLCEVLRVINSWTRFVPKLLF